MKPISITILLFISWSPISAQDRKQPNNSFQTDYFQALDHWVVLPELDQLLLGYIYLDPKSGYAFALHAPISINGNSWTVKSPTKQILNRPLDSKTPKVFLVPQSKLSLLGLPPKPIWLKVYDENRFENLLAVAKRYNTLSQFDLAVRILKPMLESNPDGCLFYRELGFALAQCYQIEEAERIYELGLSNCKNDVQKLEMAIDMTNLFYDLKQQQPFVKWSMLVKKYSNANQINPRFTDPSDDGN